MRELSPLELKAYLSVASPHPLLLDVREPDEYDFCHIEGSVPIPMNELPGRIDELNADDEIVVICHHGVRSRVVAAFLVGRHFKRVINLSGGVEAWACTVDKNMPRY